MKHQPERTCIGCRGAFPKDEVLRIVAGPTEAVLDYREKMPGRAAYVCVRRECVEKALSRENLSRALKQKVKSPIPATFIAMLVQNILERIRSLIAMSSKAGKLAGGYSAVQDALQKGRVKMLLFTTDIADGTREKIDLKVPPGLREATVLTRQELGSILNRELVGVVAFEDQGLADAVWKETERLKSLINNNE
ncbi:MAG: hypothetical protein A2010_00965 [Nitrospirae bacterium GWD2_57_9]|nr:MAG: hypothetical protein A2010_00965 [Nitrospirae bacterium GWD2_57_9]